MLDNIFYCFFLLSFLVGSSNIEHYNMFQQMHSSKSDFTYGLTYLTPHRYNLVKGFESTKRVAQRHKPGVCVALVEDVNEIVSHITHLNEKICDLTRKHKHGSKLLPKAKTCTLRFSKYEGYGHELVNT